MQSPTCTNLWIRSVPDAELILHAVYLNKLPMITRRLDDEERMALTSGCVYVWEERSSNPLEATGQEIQRFTEGRSWGPSRARDDFLLYHEKENTISKSALHFRNRSIGSSPLVKQTYSVFVHVPGAPSRKWHLNAYYTPETVDRLMTIDQIPILRSIKVPQGQYICARTNNARRSARLPNQGLEQDRAVSHRSSSCISDISLDIPMYGPESGRDTSPTILDGIASQLHPRLAPLDFLQNLPHKPRDPIDDQAIRSLCKKMW